MKNKLDYLRDFWRDSFKYLHKHKNQGKIVVLFLSLGFAVSMIIFTKGVTASFVEAFL